MVFVFRDRQFDFSSRTFIMGVLNVTPDSFSDGGKFNSLPAALEQARRMVSEGVDIIDVGGESTRPRGGTETWSVGAEEELRRVLPVIEELHRRDPSAVISIDTSKSVVAEEALKAGACIVNDVTGFRADPSMAAVVAKHKASAVVMHMKGTPATMQIDPQYEDVMGEIRASLKASLSLAEREGIGQVMVDPGIGFGKNLEHNLRILRRLKELHELGRPILVGPSRKSFIGALTGAPVDQRLAGTAAAVAAAIYGGAHIVRVHDVGFMKQVCRVTDSILHSA